MRKFPATIRHTDVMRSLDNLLDPEQRRFQLTGTRQQTYDDTVTYRVADVTNMSDGEIERKHGSVTPIPPDGGRRRSPILPPAIAPYWTFNGLDSFVVRERDGQLVKEAA